MTWLSYVSLLKGKNLDTQEFNDFFLLQAVKSPPAVNNGGPALHKIQNEKLRLDLPKPGEEDKGLLANWNDPTKGQL